MNLRDDLNNVEFFYLLGEAAIKEKKIDIFKGTMCGINMYPSTIP